MKQISIIYKKQLWNKFLQEKEKFMFAWTLHRKKYNILQMIIKFIYDKYNKMYMKNTIYFLF